MPDYQPLVFAARQTLDLNRQQGPSEWEGRHYDFVCPSHDAYPFQWAWDSGFHSIALLHVNPELAKQELRCLLQGAQSDGFLPHMLLWERATHEDVLAKYNIALANPYFTATISRRSNNWLLGSIGSRPKRWDVWSNNPEHRRLTEHSTTLDQCGTYCANLGHRGRTAPIIMRRRCAKWAL